MPTLTKNRRDNLTCPDATPWHDRLPKLNSSAVCLKLLQQKSSISPPVMHSILSTEVTIRRGQLKTITLSTATCFLSEHRHDTLDGRIARLM